jgi:hypothetical protein
MEDSMNGLSPHARRLLDLGKDVGEPDPQALAQTRASLMARVGAVATVTTVTAAAVSAEAAAASPAVTGAAAAWLVPTPFVTKLAVALVLVVGAGTVAYRAHLPAARPAPASVSVELRPVSTVTVDRTAAPPKVVVAVATPASPPERIAPARPVQRPVPPAVAADLPGTEVQRTEAQTTIAAPAGAGASLAADVASLREAQAALVAGHPEDALEAAEHVRASGPLSDEREGMLILAQCALGASDARARAQAFVAGRSQAPLAIRVRTACLGAN